MEILVGLIVVIIAVVYFVPGIPDILGLNSSFKKYWSKGIVPPNLDTSSESLSLIHISLAGLLVGQHPVEVHKKLVYLYKYLLNDKNLRQTEDSFNNYFNDVKVSLIQARKYPIQIDSVAAYLNKHRFNSAYKLKLIQFLANLAFIDQQIHPLELKVIESLGAKLFLDAKLVAEIISPMKDSQERRAKQEQESWKNRTTSQYSSPNLKAKYCAILGVSTQADLKTIKKAYRKLAMEHHPDKFINAAKPVYEAAQLKFIEIQSAYEYLEKNA